MVRKVVSYIIILFLSFTAVFFILRLIPGNPIRAYVYMLRSRYGFEPIGDRTIQMFEEMFGLNEDVFSQYLIFLRRLLFEFNLGPSFMAFPTPAQDLIIRHLPWTIILLSVTTLLSWIIGLMLGVIIGWKRGSRFDNFFFTFSLIFSQIPYYIVAVILLLLFAYIFPIFPSRGAYAASLTLFDVNFVISAIQHAFLPALSIILVSMTGWLISTRALVITIVGEDYLQYAQAKGLSNRRILTRYILRNTLLPQTTGLAISLGFIVTGAFLVEWIFVYPGIGALFVNAIGLLDFNVIQGIIMLTMFTVLTANLIMDLIYPLIDPRVAIT
ncbi:Oligopeptide transport system permease protein OppB [Candidatus Calditenuaceae archaeon HR02]|nr:Oligopeptide transport system permease protein OppB [Candidatus Calditenuaceae archaeon HR02]